MSRPTAALNMICSSISRPARSPTISHLTRSTWSWLRISSNTSSGRGLWRSAVKSTLSWPKEALSSSACPTCASSSKPQSRCPVKSHCSTADKTSIKAITPPKLSLVRITPNSSLINTGGPQNRSTRNSSPSGSLEPQPPCIGPISSSKPINPNDMTHLDLFSGIGGFALAARWCGIETIGFSETDPYACAVLTKNFPGIPNYGDVRHVKNIKADLITGGFPCQPVSIAGKRRGSSDDRWLWPEMCRIIEECQPRWVLAENVPGIINLGLDQVLSDLETLRYTTGTFVIPACALDAPHRRDRVWIVAHTQSERCGETGSQQPSTSSSAQLHGNVAHANRHHRIWRPSSLQMGREQSQSQTQADGQSPGTQWPPEPSVGRMAHGISHRVDRLKCLGNAIVPQIAAQILTFILQTHKPQ